MSYLWLILLSVVQRTAHIVIYNWDQSQLKPLTETYVYYLLQKTWITVSLRLIIHHNNRNKSINKAASVDPHPAMLTTLIPIHPRSSTKTYVDPRPALLTTLIPIHTRSSTLAYVDRRQAMLTTLILLYTRWSKFVYVDPRQAMLATLIPIHT